MEALNVLLPVVLYVVAIILLIVLIMVGLRLLTILDKVDRIVDDVEEKVSSLDHAFEVLSKAANGVASISDSLMGKATSIVTKFLKRKIKEDDYYE